MSSTTTMTFSRRRFSGDDDDEDDRTEIDSRDFGKNVATREYADLAFAISIGKILLAIEFALIAFWTLSTPYIVVHDFGVPVDAHTFSGDHILFALHLATGLTVALVIEHYKPHLPNENANKKMDTNKDARYGDDRYMTNHNATPSSPLGSMHRIDSHADAALGIGYLASWAIGILGAVVTDVIGLAWLILVGKHIETSHAYRIELSLAIWAIADTSFVSLWSLWLLMINLGRRRRRRRSSQMRNVVEKDGVDDSAM